MLRLQPKARRSRRMCLVNKSVSQSLSHVRNERTVDISDDALSLIMRVERCFMVAEKGGGDRGGNKQRSSQNRWRMKEG